MLADAQSHSVKQLSEPDTVQPIPARYWWLKRISVASGVLLVGLVLLRVWWGYEAERRLQATIKHYQDAGQPVLPSEFDAILDAVPDDQNAAILYEQAMKKMVFLSTSGVHVNAFYYDETTTLEKDRPAADELIQKNAEVFALVREARGRPRIAWSTRLTGMASGGSWGKYLSRQRSLGKLLFFSIRYHFDTGNHSASVETMYDFLLLSDRIAAHPGLLANLVSFASGVLVTKYIEECSAELLIDQVGIETGGSIIPSTRGQIKKLLERLLDDSRTQHNYVQSIHAERAYLIDLVNELKSVLIPIGGTPFSVVSYVNLTETLSSPLLKLSNVRHMHEIDELVLANSEATWAKAKDYFPQESPEQLIDIFINPIGSTPPSLGRASLLCYRYLARRRMASVALAIRLYEIDHGHRPEALQLLVPDYLAKIPADPFDRDDAPILYKLDGDAPILYSVGSNGEDNHGLDFRSFDDRREGEKKGDIVFYLVGRPEDKE